MHKVLALVCWATLAPHAFGAPQSPSPITVRFENRSAASYDGWAHASVPLPPGHLRSAATLANYSLGDVATNTPTPTVATPMKWHWSGGTRSSIALVKVRARVQLPANSSLELGIVQAPGLGGGFTWDGDMWQWLQGGTLGEDVFLLARFAGDPHGYIARPTGELVALEETAAAYVTRGRTRFRRVDDNTVTHTLTMTTYWSLQAGQKHGNVTIVVGNDTLERPLSGGIQIEQLVLAHRMPFVIAPRAQPATAVRGPYYFNNQYAWWSLLDNTPMADGQTFAVDFAFCLSRTAADPAVSSMLAATANPIVGIADAPSWRASGAAGATGFVPAARFPDLAAGRQAATTASIVPTAAALEDLGVVNRNPPGTGDQPDFMSNLPVFFLQCVQTGSSSPLNKALVGARRECWRPSNYFDRANGRSERVSLLTYPDLFFWSGRPHYDASWNPQYPQWTTRAGAFVPGNTSGWSGMDNQHAGHNGVRAAYELTGDPYLAELLRANMSILYWDFFTDWMAHTEAERTGRMLKEAIMLYALFPDAPEAPVLRNAITQKLQVFANAATSWLSRYGFPAIASVRNDARVPLTQQFPNQDVHMSWQTGFHMEAMSLAVKVLDDANARFLLQTYLDRAHLLFLPDGTPKTYTLMSDPTQYATGGIGLGWWSGWVLANRLLPNNANYALLEQQLLPRIRQQITPAPGVFWWTQDRWRCFD